MIINPATVVGTTGSVFFAGASGLITQDNANLFWDDTNNRLGIGNAAPADTLHVTGGLKMTGGGVNGVDIDTGSKSYYIRTTSGAGTGAVDSFTSMDIGSVTCTGIAIGSTSSIGAIFCTYLGLSGILYVSNMPDGASAVGHTFITPSYTTAGSKIVSFTNAYVEKAYVDKLGDIWSRRELATGTVPTSSSFVLGATWGNTATVTAISGNDRALKFTITANGTGRGANAVCTYTFKDGAYGTAPLMLCIQQDASATADIPDAIKWSTTTTTFVLTYIPTPGAATTHTFTVFIIG